MSLIPLAVGVLAMIADERRLRRTSVGIVAGGLTAVFISTAGFGA
jgi:hypothetical protein